MSFSIVSRQSFRAAGVPFEDFSSLTRIEGDIKERKCPSRLYGEPVEQLDHGEIRIANAEDSCPEQTFASKEILESLEEVGASYPEAQYYPYLKKIYLYGMTFRELALEEDVSLRTIQVRVKQTLEFMKSKLV